jgi:hypothetical protein
MDELTGETPVDDFFSHIRIAKRNREWCETKGE